MMIIPLGPGPVPEYRWVGAPTARKARARCTGTGVMLLVWALVAGVLTVLVGGRLPTADHPIHPIGVISAVVAPVVLLLAGVAALGARRQVSAEHVEVAGGRMLGRLMLGLATSAIVFTALSGAVLLLTADAVEQTDGVRGVVPAVGGYLLLPASCAVIGLVGAVLTRRALRAPVPSPPGLGGAVTDHMPVSAPDAARMRSAVTRAAVGFLVAAALLAATTVALVAVAPDETGPGSLTILGGGNGTVMVLLAGTMLLDARQLVSGQTFLARRARRLHRLLLMFFLLSVVIGGLCAYGSMHIADEGEPVIAPLLLPLAACVLTALAVVVARSVLRPPAVRG